ncbi:hypothetical protein MML48_6g00018173 [Holotrichia oblita]|uniref:Uncharacterized protein n=1 Tax=Holotrichia oblita TaxID=644536 RepID=A0ACB9SXJ3_HOLOL|nr:hypothetical protein MML48_6g00018173 [Holotrichia oblita]
MQSELERKAKIAITLGIVGYVKKIVDGEKGKPKRQRVRKWIEQRVKNYSTLSLVDNELSVEDEMSYKNFLRMDKICYEELLHLVPNTVEEWETVASNFNTRWQFPNCLGALDGKHINFEAPRSAGSIYWNYKQRNSIVLLALVDSDSDLNQALLNNYLNIPPDGPLPNTTTSLPYVIVADAAFPLQKLIMKPFPFRNLTGEQRIFNYRLSRARRVSENAFGILSNRFRILLTNIKLAPEKVESIVLSCCVLQNFLIERSATYLCSESVDTEDLIAGSSQQTSLELGSLQNSYRRPTTNALSIRQQYTNYFDNVGAVPW